MSFFKFLFLPRQLKSKKPFDYDKNDYRNLRREQLELHKSYLKEMESEENSRLLMIENKTAQLVSQTGLVFALLSLFVPFIVETVLNAQIIFRVVFIMLLIMCFLCYILAIINSLKNFNVKKFNYGYKSPMTILNHQSLSEKKFMQMEIKDALYCINNNIEMNNRKATHLIRGYHFFKFGIVSTAVLVVFLCASLLFINGKESENGTKQPLETPIKKEFLENTTKRDFEKVHDSIKIDTMSKAKID